jgi:cation transport regulator ChaC
MWYFAYGSNLNSRAVSDWCRHHGHRTLALHGGKPAVLDNYRLGFPIFSEYWGGGIADVVYDPGKYVMGVLFDLQEAELAVLDRKVVRERDALGREVGVYHRVNVKVSPLGKGESVMAVTYQGVSVDRNHVPPTRHYMDLLTQGACAHGLSTMWVSYLRSFDTQTGRKPRPIRMKEAVVA